MITNADITIFNRKYDPVTRLDVWQRTFIKGVSFYHDVKTAAGEHGLNKAHVYKIRIPERPELSKTYANEDRWNGAGWTLQDGDIIVRGDCEPFDKPSDLSKLGKEYCTIISWSDNRRGTLPHWRVGGE